MSEGGAVSDTTAMNDGLAMGEGNPIGESPPVERTSIAERGTLAERLASHRPAIDSLVSEDLSAGDDIDYFDDFDGDAADAADGPRPDQQPFGSRFAFRTRLTVALIAAAVLPLAAFGFLLVYAQRLPDSAVTIPRLLILAIVLAALLAVLVA